MCLLVEHYRKLELERKKVRVQKTSSSGPMIRYHSVAMPIIREDDSEPNVT